MPEPPKTAFLTRFRPGATSPAPSPQEALSLSLVTELRGVRHWAYADGRQLARQLTIAFRRMAAHLCANARLVGLSPPGHAPLTIHSVAYNGSTCGIGDAVTPITVYAGDIRADWTLAVNAPDHNLYPFYAWPQPVIEGLAEPSAGLPAARVDFALARFDNGDDTYGGVRYPMRLIIDRGSLGRIVVAERNRGDSPVVTGSGQRLTCAEQPLMQVDAQQIGHALDSASPPAEPGVYPLDLVIYDGDGDQVFSASCLAATPSTDADPALPPPPVTAGGSFGEFRARQGGDYGAFELCRVPVAMVEYRPMPPAFVLPLTGGYYGVSCNGTHGPTSEAVGENGHWTGAADGKPIVVSWGSAGIYYGGRLRVVATKVAAACIKPMVLISGDAPVECLAWVTTYPHTFTVRPLARPDDLGIIWGIAAPAGLANTRNLSFSPGALNLAWCERAAVSTGRNGRVHVARTPAIAGAPLSWVRVDTGSDNPAPVVAASGYVEDNVTQEGEMAWAIVDGATWSGEDAVPDVFTYTYTQRMERAKTRTGESPPDIDYSDAAACACPPSYAPADGGSWVCMGLGARELSPDCPVLDDYPQSADYSRTSTVTGRVTGAVAFEHIDSVVSASGVDSWAFLFGGQWTAVWHSTGGSSAAEVACCSAPFWYAIDGTAEMTWEGAPAIRSLKRASGQPGWVDNGAVTYDFSLERSGAGFDPGTVTYAQSGGLAPVAPGQSYDITVYVGSASALRAPGGAISGNYAGPPLELPRYTSEASLAAAVRSAFIAAVGSLFSANVKAATAIDGTCSLVQASTASGTRTGSGTTLVDAPTALWIAPTALGATLPRDYPAIPDWSPPAPEPYEIIAAINTARADLPPLQEDGLLAARAFALLEELAALPADAPLRAPVHDRLIGTEPDAELMVMAWQASATHRARLLDPAWRRVGAHTADTPTHGSLWVVCFGRDT